MKKIIGFLATLALMLTIFLTGSMDTEAAEAAGIKNISVDADYETADKAIYSLTNMKIKMDYVLPEGATFLRAYVTFTNDQSIYDNEYNTLSYGVTFDGNSVTMAEASQKALGTFKLSQATLLVTDSSNQVKTYDYTVSSTDSSSLILNTVDTTAIQSIDICQYEVEAYPSALSLESYSLRSETDDYDFNNVSQGETFYLDVCLKNVSEEQYKLPLNECSICYDIFNENQDSSLKDFYASESSKVKWIFEPGEERTVSIPISFPKFQTQTGSYEFKALSIGNMNGHPIEEQLEIYDRDTINRIKTLPISNTNVDFTVVEGINDTDKPILKNISYFSDFTELENTVTTESNLTFNLSCKDISGIGKVRLDFGHHHITYNVPTGQGENGEVQFTVNLKDLNWSDTGVSTLDYVTVYDGVGNYTSYSVEGDAEEESSLWDGAWVASANQVKFEVIESLSNTVEVFLNADKENLSLEYREGGSPTQAPDIVIGNSEEETDDDPVEYIVIPLENNMYHDYTIDPDKSVVKWTLTKSGVSYDIEATYDHLSKWDDEDDAPNTLKRGESGDIFFKIQLPEPTYSTEDGDKIFPGGKAVIDSVSIYGSNKNGSYLTQCDAVSNTKNFTMTFGPVEEEVTLTKTISYKMPLNFNLINSLEDTEAPYITNLERTTDSSVYTKEPICFKVGYSDDKSNVEKITLKFIDDDTRKVLQGSVNTGLSQTGTADISIDFTDTTKDLLGSWRLYQIIISDTEGNTVTYYDNYQPENWSKWKNNTTFERTANPFALQIEKAELRDISDKTNVNPGATFSVYLTVYNNTDDSFTTNSFKLFWDTDNTEGNESSTTTELTIDKNAVIAGYGEKLINLSFTLNDKEECGQRTLRNITITGTSAGKDAVLSLEKQSNGAISQHYNDDLTLPVSTPKINADFAIHHYESVTTPATPTTDGAIENKCTLCNEVRASEGIPYPANITLSSTEFVYNGNVQTPAVTVTDTNGNAIPSTEYTVTYADGRIAAGQYNVTITFQNNYSGVVTKTFTIKNPQNPSGSGDSGNSGNTGNTGGSGSTGGAGSNPIASGSGSNTPAPSTATASTVGSIKGTKISSAKAAKKKVTLKWKKQVNKTNGYEVQYSLKKDFKSGVKTKTIKNNKTTSLVLKKLKSKKTYYIRIRTYQNTAGGKNYSVWSSAKKVKVK